VPLHGRRDVIESLTVVTPENIEVTYEPAAVGSRGLAVFVDHLLQALIAIVGLLAMSMAAFGVGSLGDVFRKNVPFWLAAASLVWTFSVFWGYFAAFEILWAGQTPGKRLVGLRVMRDGGFPVDPISVLIRNIVRLADMLPPVYGAGIVSMFANRQCKRLGDWAAGTVVVKERRYPLPSPFFLGDPSPTVARFLQIVPRAPELSTQDYQLLRRFVERRHSMAVPVQAHVALRLAEQILPKLNLEITLRAQVQYADLLEAILRRYMLDRGKV